MYVFTGSTQLFVNLYKTDFWFLCSTTNRKFNPSLVTTGKRILLPHFEKKLFPLTYT